MFLLTVIYTIGMLLLTQGKYALQAGMFQLTQIGQL
jgi:hypothetical protein